MPDRWRAAAGLVTMAMLAGPVPPVVAQTPLGQHAEALRQALVRHDPGGLLQRAERLHLRLPGFEPGAPLSRPEAAAILRDFLAGGEELDVVVRRALEAGHGRGVVELERRFRPVGRGDERTQFVLLDLVWTPAGWLLLELRVVS